ncbi:DMT family transporter [Microbacterium sp. gxy059]|uniref:DMT family transporter n=1 Tax=Microbacterium sp. gxy059 TaxID=2957199 RepID=UPI003D973F20
MGIPSRGRAGLAVGVIGAYLVGALTALQARLNGDLGAGLDDAFLAAVISFGSGLVIVAALSALLPAGRQGLRRLREGVRRGAPDRIPWWMLCGGAAGAFTVTTQGLTVGAIGVALFSVGMVAGQTVGGLVLDRMGVGPAGVAPVTAPRLVGALLVLAAVVVSLGGDALASVPWWMLALPFAVGAGVAWQTAVNGRLRQRVGSALAATTASFAGGTVLLAVVAAGSVLANGWPTSFPTEPWTYAGGLLGVIYIFTSATLTPRTGVLVMTVGSVLGLITSSIAYDLIWIPDVPTPPWRTIAMAALALGGVAATLWRRRR